ncbi:MAG: DeoR/GlpR family DNA-binding transcription regulator [Syntrophales bacterium]
MKYFDSGCKVFKGYRHIANKRHLNRMIPYQRREKIISELQRKKTCTVLELSKLLNVSKVTVHRDLVRLDQAGIVEKIYGGVTLAKPSREGTAKAEQRVDIRLRMQVEEKKDIAKRAVGLIRDETSIFIDHSSTSIYLAREIRNLPYKNLIIVTNSITILNELEGALFTSLVSTGGNLQRQWSALGGAITLDFLSKLNFDQIFISCGGISIERGLMTSFTFVTEILKKASAVAREINLLVDSSKFSKMGTFSIMPVTSITQIITDRKLSVDLVEKYQNLGVKVDL